MRSLRAGVVLLALLAAVGCSQRERPSGTATATLFGPDARLDAWTTSVVEGVHVHAFQPEEPCVAAGMSEVLGAASGTLPEGRLDLKQVNATLDALTESMLATANGPAHGGAGRAVVALRRAASDESILVDLPLLKAGEKDRTFRAGELKAVYSQPARRPRARLARGWVRAVRLDGGGTDYELFLVFTPERPDARIETIQVVTRLAWPPR
jgi:hypothetical protein